MQAGRQEADQAGHWDATVGISLVVTMQRILFVMIPLLCSVYEYASAILMSWTDDSIGSFCFSDLYLSVLLALFLSFFFSFFLSSSCAIEW